MAKDAFGSLCYSIPDTTCSILVSTLRNDDGLIRAFSYVTIDLFEETAIFARPYSLLILLTLVNFLVLKKTIEENKNPTALFYISAMMISWTHHLGYLYLLSIFLNLLIFNHFKKTFIILSKLGLLLIPSIVYLAYQHQNSRQRIDWINDLVDQFSIFRIFSDSGYHFFINLLIIFSMVLTFLKRNKLPTLYVFLNNVIITSIIGMYLTLLTPNSLLFDRYFSFLVPLLTLSSIMFLKLVMNLKTHQLSWVIAFMAFVNVFPAHIFEHRIDYKKFFSLVSLETFREKRTLCIHEWYPQITDRYSVMKLGKEICDNKEKAWTGEMFYQGYDMILRIKPKYSQQMEKIPGTLIFQFEEFSLYERSP